MAISFDGVLVIGLVAVAVPAICGWWPGLPVPGAVLEVIAGIVIGPSVLGWVHVDAAVQVLSDLGLGMLLFLAGLEIDVQRLRGPLGRVAGAAFAVSAVLGLLCAIGLGLAGLASQPLFLAIVLISTSTGLLLPLLKDAGEESTQFGQLVMTAAALAEVVPILLLSLLFSAASKTSAQRIASLAIFLLLLVTVGLALGRVRRLEGLERLLNRLDDQSAQLRVRAALTLALGFGVLAYRFGFASILGAFAAGLLVRMIDITGHTPHPQFEIKLQGIGFGFLIPIFFIVSGIHFDLHALVHKPKVLLLVPVFAVLFLLTRGVPTWAFFRTILSKAETSALAILASTGLPLIVVITTIGVDEHKMKPQNASALVAAGMLSVLVFPILGLRPLRARTNPAAEEGAVPPTTPTG